MHPVVLLLIGTPLTVAGGLVLGHLTLGQADGEPASQYASPRGATRRDSARLESDKPSQKTRSVVQGANGKALAINLTDVQIAFIASQIRSAPKPSTVRVDSSGSARKIGEDIARALKRAGWPVSVYYSVMVIPPLPTGVFVKHDGQNQAAAKALVSALKASSLEAIIDLGDGSLIGLRLTITPSR